MDARWTYMLRLVGINPNDVRMDKLAEYMKELAALLGTDNNPVFAGIKVRSTGLLADVPTGKQGDAWKRVQSAKSDPASRPARHLKAIEGLLGRDGISCAELRDRSDRILISMVPSVDDVPKPIVVYQDGEIDGIVTGVVGADETMHLHLRTYGGEIIRFIVKNEELAKRLLSHFRTGSVRLRVQGPWERTDLGWFPQSTKCTVIAYEVLEDALLVDIFDSIADVPDNGWCRIEDPVAAWEDLRGIH